MSVNYIKTSARLIKQKLLHRIDKVKWRQVIKNSKNVFLGPWTGEVGPELQYWIPYLRRIRNLGFFDNRKIIAVSRGGVDIWYSGLVDEYLDIFDYQDAKEFSRIHINSKTKSRKQLDWTKSEQGLIEKIVKNKKIYDFAVVHPSVMWREIIPWLEEKMTLDKALTKLAFKRFPQASEFYIDFVNKLMLPKQFLAIKFYTNDIFKPTAENQEFVTGLINFISKKHNIVILGMEIQIDEHNLFKSGKLSKVMDIESKVPIRFNLGIQTEVLRRSIGFIGTNGGFSVLGAFVGKPSLSFYSEKLGNYTRIHYQHETVTNKLYEELNSGSYSVINTETWRSLIYDLAV